MKQIRSGLSQEGLKQIACVTMLLDHIGAVLLPAVGLRVIGRIAFPIYCFLLVEGIAHTRDPKRYGLRLLICALLSELPYDLMVSGGVDWTRQNVMVTLLTGFCVIQLMKLTENGWIRAAVILTGAMTAEWMKADYGGLGVLLIAMFGITRNMSGRLALQTVGLALICWLLPSGRIQFGDIFVPIQIFGVAAMIPIALYSGSKRTGRHWLRWVFYSFYPVHMLILYLLAVLR